MRRKIVKRYLFWIRLQQVFRLLPTKLKGKFTPITLIIILNTILDLFGIALFIPLLLLLLNDDYVEKYDFIKRIYNFLNFSNQTNFTILLLGLIFLLIIAKNIISILISRHQTKLIFDIQTEISALTLKSFLQSNLLKLKEKNSNKIIWEVTVLPMYFTRFLVLPLITFLNELLITLIIGCSLLFINPKLVLVTIIIPIIYVFYLITNKKIKEYQKRSAQISPVINSLVQQAVFGYTDILLTQTKDNYLKKYNELQDEHKGISTNIFTYIFIPAKIIEISTILVVILLIVVGLLFGDNKEDVVSFLGMFAIAAYRLIPSFNRITTSLMSFKSYQYTLNMLSKSLDKIKVDNSKKDKKEDVLNFNTDIKLDHINFSYKKGIPILKDISFAINKGNHIGIIGKSGSGKSTLMNIILDVTTNYEGNILIDNKKITENNIHHWFQKIGYVQQNIFLMDGTIKENIAFGKFDKEIDLNKVNQAIKDANLIELIASLPKGIDTKVGELGNLISGGQKQRIGIARAIYADSEILLLDEATSSLDSNTEALIIETLNDLSKRKEKLTIITIAHRLSTLKYCDKIIDLEKGGIETSYENLLKP